VTRGDASYLAVTVRSDPNDPRTDDIVGDIVRDGQIQADWGLHLIDVSLTAGNLLEVAKQQTASYTAAAATDAQVAKTPTAPATPARQRGDRTVDRSDTCTRTSVRRRPYQLSMNGRFLPVRGVTGGVACSAVMIHARESAGSITSSISPCAAMLTALPWS
jgi:hypothetical protein